MARLVSSAARRFEAAARCVRWTTEQYVDAVRVRAVSPSLAVTLRRTDGYASLLRPFHREYIAEVSTPVMAVSLPVASVIWAACDALQPKTILDLGSGFSTFVVARWAATNEAHVTAIDDDPHWLRRTAGFLTRHAVPLPDLRPLSAAPLPVNQGLVFLDLGLPPRRIGLFAEAANAVAPTGVMILDDMNQHPYGAQVRVAARPNGLRLYSIRRYTKDDLGRFAAIALTRQKARYRERDRAATP